ncbi:MAG: sulfurtransferase [Salinibacterium sp.]|nr:sulfurtransferase [Salinibacterium sp.]
MTSPFISVGELADALSGSNPPAVLDASLVLHPAQFDGDYRRDSGRPRWIAGHIPGSLHVDVASDFSDTTATLHYTHPEPQAIADELARLGIREKRDVVVYDSTGNLFAARLWYLLRWIGVSVRVLDGGFAAWQAAGERVETGEGVRPEPVPTWSASAVRAAWVSKSELLQRTPDDTRPLVCGLPAGSFTGADFTRYDRRGRIPGSVNVSSRDLFTADGHVKTRVELILAYDAAGIDIAEGSDDEVLLYCGGGISAAGNALTLAAIGKKAVRIYDGSLEEWSADPSLPLDSGQPA